MPEQKKPFQMSQEIYTPENVPLYEAMYGPGLISLEGEDCLLCKLINRKLIFYIL